MWDTLRQDIVFGARMLWRQPGFTVVAVLALALGIGANAAIFSLIYSVFIRPLPYEHAPALMRLWGQSTDGRLARLGASVPKFDHLKRSQRSFTALAGDSAQAMALTGLSDEPQRVTALDISATDVRTRATKTNEGWRVRGTKLGPRARMAASDARSADVAQSVPSLA